MDTANQFERRFVSLAAGKAKNAYGDQSKFARHIFPDGDAVTKWRAIRNTSKGKPQSLRLEDAVKTAPKTQPKTKNRIKLFLIYTRPFKK